MAENTERGSGNSNNALYFIVGGLVVIAGIFLFLYANGEIGGDGDANVTPPAATAPAPEAPAAPAPATPAPAPSSN